MAPNSNKTTIAQPSQDQPPSLYTHIEVEPEIIQALWRCLLACNPHWMTYYDRDHTDKTNHKNALQACVGRKTKSGVDYSKRAYQPYYFDPIKVNENQDCFGFWTKDINDHWIYACADLEPMLNSQKCGRRVDRNPKPEKRLRIRTEANDLYDSWYHLAYTDHRILAIYLVESSPDHYHVGALFTKPLPMKQHDELLERALSTTMKITHVDKYSTRAKKGLGDHFRAPFTWKNGHQSRCVKIWYRSKEQLLARAAEVKPPIIKTLHTSGIKDPSSPDTVLQWAIEHYPIRPSTRHKIQNSLILSLLNRGISPALIRTIGPDWLTYYNNQPTVLDTESQNFKTDLEQAVTFFNNCLDSILNDTDVQSRIGRNPTLNYDKFVRNYKLNDTQLDLIGTILHSDKQELSSLFSIDKDDSSYNTPQSIQLFQNYLVIEAIIITIEINKLQKLDKGKATFTHNQILQTIVLRHSIEIDPRQFQRIKERFVSFKLTNGKDHEATIVELLKETLKGTPSIPSEYKIDPILLL